MEPRIQYAQTADGVSVAFWTLGEGMALVRIPPAPLHEKGRPKLQLNGIDSRLAREGEC